jgi:hypothetical protein
VTSAPYHIAKDVAGVTGSLNGEAGGLGARRIQPTDCAATAAGPCVLALPVACDFLDGMTVNTRYNALMGEVCVRYGFCGSCVDGTPSHVGDLIPSSGPVTADQFVDWLVIADGLDLTSFSEHRKPLKRQLRAAFIKHMGAEVVDASDLQWEI